MPAFSFLFTTRLKSRNKLEGAKTDACNVHMEQVIQIYSREIFNFFHVQPASVIIITVSICVLDNLLPPLVSVRDLTLIFYTVIGGDNFNPVYKTRDVGRLSHG